MIDVIKKGILAGIGATVITKEKVEASLGDLVQKGRLSAQEARETAGKIVEDSKQEYAQTKEEINTLFTELLRKARFATQDEVKALESRIQALEERLSK